MNTLIVFLALALVAAHAVPALDKDFVAQTKAKLLKIGTECIKENGVANDEAAELRQFKLPTTHNGKCAVFCFNKRLNIQKEDGSADKAGMAALTEHLKSHDADLHAKATDIFMFCADSVAVDSDPCNTATALFECGKKEAVARGIPETFYE